MSVAVRYPKPDIPIGSTTTSRTMTLLGHIKKYKKLYHPEDPVTYKEGMEISGVIWEKTWSGMASTFLFYLTWTLGLVHFLMKVVLEHEVLDMQIAMEALHWVVMHLLGITGGASLTLKTNTFMNLHDLIKSGVFTYKAGLNPTQEKILSDERDRIHSYVKLFFNAFLIAFVCTQLKGILFDRQEWGVQFPGYFPFTINSYGTFPSLKDIIFASQEWGVQFPGYFPFTINSYGTYAVALLFQFVLGFNVVVSAQALAGSYCAFSCHLCSQVRILAISIENIFRDPKDYHGTKERLKACVQHHNTIIRFYEMLQQFYSITLFVLSVALILMMCLVGYVITDPESELIVIIPLLTVFVPEMVVVSLFCYSGQRIMDESENLSITIYNIKWYDVPLSIRKDLILMLMKSQKTFKISGAGLQTYSLQGLSEILQTSYTYFNMLVALRKK